MKKKKSAIAWYLQDALLVLAMLNVAPVPIESFNKIIYILIFFIGGLGLLFPLLVQKKMNKIVYMIAISVFTLNTLSSLSAIYISKITFNLSWYIQINLWAGILIVSYLAISNGYPIKRALRYLSLTVLFVILHITLMLTLGSSYSNIFSLEYFLNDSYYALSISREYGFEKTGLIMLFHVFVIISCFHYSKRKRYLLFLLGIIYPIILGSKTALVGCVFIMILYMVNMSNSKSIKKLLLYCFYGLFGLTVSINWTAIDEYGVSKGRYLVPVLESIDFWAHPFGFGAGNYVQVAESGMIDIELTSDPEILITKVERFGYEGDAYGLFPASESNWLWFGVCFGWVTVLLIFLQYMKLIHLSLTLRTRDSPSQIVMSSYVVTYFVGAGIFQDHINIHASWVILAFVVSIIMTQSSIRTKTSLTMDRQRY